MLLAAFQFTALYYTHNVTRLKILQNDSYLFQVLAFGPRLKVLPWDNSKLVQKT